jgi:hypothetical protein
MPDYTATQVRSDFTYARMLMREADRMMREGITDFSESGEAGQLALELVASVTTFRAYLDERS